MSGPIGSNDASEKRTRTSWYHPVALARGLAFRPKLYFAIGAGLAVFFLAPAELVFDARAVSAWNVGAVVYLALGFRLMATCSHVSIRERAAREDETRFVFFGLILSAVAISLASVIALIGEAKTATGSVKAFYLAMAAVAILASWLVMQVVFTLHYAHDFYRMHVAGKQGSGGLEFPADEQPDYWDFFYFATSIGATSQTSDVEITAKQVRRMVAFQAIVSFVFNTTVVALSINLAAGML